MAAICILSFITSVAYTKAERPIILLNATVTEPETNVQPPLNNSEIKAISVLDEHQASAVRRPVDNIQHQSSHEQSGQWRTMRMRVTAYCPCSKCCGQYSDGVTACGHKIRPGDTFVAADKRYSFGTEMVITGYGNGQPVKVLDRGGAIKGNKLDLFFGTHKEALKWGVKYLDVKVREN